MPGGQTTTQQQQQSSVSNPWGPSQSLLQGILGQLGNQSTAPSMQQQGAIQNLYNATGSLPNFTPAATDTANLLLSGGNAGAQAGNVQGAYNNLQSTLSPYLSSSYLNPMQTPGFSDALKTVNSDISNQVNDQFAAAGRDLSPGNSTALARGLSQGEGQLISNQFNQNVAAQQGAAGTLYGAGNTTAGMLSGMNQQGLQNMLSGGQFAGMIPSLATGGSLAQLQAANMGAQLPYQNLGWLESLAVPIAGLGGQTSGQGTGSTTQQTPWYTTALGAGLGGLGTLGQMGMFSDERVKEDIEPIGLLFDGSPVYSYRYAPEIDPTGTPRIGLMAQDVEKTRPDAVAEVGGVKVVNYDRATERARRIGGMLDDLEMAA